MCAPRNVGAHGIAVQEATHCYHSICLAQCAYHAHAYMRKGSLAPHTDIRQHENGHMHDTGRAQPMGSVVGPAMRRMLQCSNLTMRICATG